ncbi:hypothetical protein V501_06292, partial [Pseudogymnoascus sp. VKM F-4519 (FW-2642)]
RTTTTADNLTSDDDKDNNTRNKPKVANCYKPDTMAEEVSPSPPPRPQPGSQPGLRSNQNQPRNQPTPNLNQPQANPIFPTMDLFRATIVRLEKAKKAGTWVPPNMDAGLAYDLGAETPAPEFISMGIYVDLNQPQAGEKPEPPKNKQHASAALPALFLKLAKATELFYHTMPDHEIRDCLPKYAKTAEERKEKTPISRVGAGKAIVKASYLDVPYHGHVRGIVKSLRRLPASPDFEDMARRQSGGGDKGGGKKGTRAKKRKEMGEEEKEDGHGIAKRSKFLGYTVSELSDHLKPIKRFFPGGHSRSVGLGGFYLAGGQGCFLRGWGYTSDTWVTQIEVVTASGQVLIANKKQNADLFWAAPGSGQGFFGVLTRIWARTIPAQKLFDTTIILDSTDIFKPLLKWALETADKVPEYGNDIFMATFYADKDAPGDGEFSEAKRVFLALNQTIHVNSIDQAKVLASPWDSLPSEFEPYVVTRMLMKERTWEELWDLQESFQPHGHGERYRVDSILADPRVSYEKIVDRVTPALFNLPTRQSTGTIVFLDYFPDEADQAVSLPQKLSVTTMAIWKDPAKDAAMDKWMYDVYKEAEKVGRGQYVADFDAEQRPTKIMSDTALKRWLQIRAKWDPAETFIGYRAFEKSLDFDLKL